MRKNEIDKLSHSYARRLSESNTTSSESLTSRAKSSLGAVNNVYQAASDATETLKTLLASADLSPKDLLQLTSALKNISSILTESREEARRTVSDLSLPGAAVPAESADPPVPVSEGLSSSIYDHMTKFSPGENSGRIFPDTADLIEEESQEEKRKKP